MLKALLRKQFMELYQAFFINRKTGKRRSAPSILAFALLYVFALGMLGVTAYGIASSLAEKLFPAGLDWLYFSLMSAFAALVGVFGSVFSTYTALYKVKDNDLLLSMPIPPHYLLLSRIAGIFVLGLIFSALIYVPAVIAAVLFGSPSFLSLLFSGLMWPLITCFSLSVSCLLGWLVALLIRRIKNKSLFTVVFSLLFFVGYYYLCFNFSDLIPQLLAHIEDIGNIIHGRILPLYLMGCGCAGNVVAFLITAGWILAVAGLTLFLLSKSFRRITIGSGGGAVSKKKHRENDIRPLGVKAALFRREWKHYLSSSVYILNCSFGTLLLPIGGTILLIFRTRIRAALAAMALPDGLLAVLIVEGGCLVTSLNNLTAPSVSLEGKTLWQIKSLPVSTAAILRAKQYLHWVLTLPPVAYFVFCLGTVFGIGIAETALATVVALLFAVCFSAIGLLLDLSHANLTWVNEIIPVKQSMQVALCTFGSWGGAVLIGGIDFAASLIMEPWMALFLLVLLLVGCALLTDRILYRRGVAWFERL